jgi:hypothetical protein
VGEVAALLLAIMLVRLITYIRNRNLPHVGGEVGPRQTVSQPPPIPDGFVFAETRAMTLFTASGTATKFRTLEQFRRKGTRRETILMHVYRVFCCPTDIEIPVDAADYERIDATEALALLSELPDPRLVRRLQLSDRPCFLDPWQRKFNGPGAFLVGTANQNGVIVLYRPSRRMSQVDRPGLTLLHEWLHLLAFRSAPALRQFARTNRLEPLPPLTKFVDHGLRNAAIHEAWADLGERLFGYDDRIAREAALAFPAHSLILWRSVENALRSTPEGLRSTRFAALENRGQFFSGAAAEKAKGRN